jgi:hypothetical protein
MTPAEFQDAKLLWKMFYAYHCFRRAEAAARHILDERLEKENPLFYPLVTSVYILYGKPFKPANWLGMSIYRQQKILTWPLKHHFS